MIRWKLEIEDGNIRVFKDGKLQAVVYSLPRNPMETFLQTVDFGVDLQTYRTHEGRLGARLAEAAPPFDSIIEARFYRSQSLRV